MYKYNCFVNVLQWGQKSTYECSEEHCFYFRDEVNSYRKIGCYPSDASFMS